MQCIKIAMQSPVTKDLIQNPITSMKTSFVDELVVGKMGSHGGGRELS